MLQIQKKIAQVFKFATVLVVTAFSTSLLPTAYAYAANNGNGNQPDNSKVTICQRTNSVTNPYIKIPVDQSAVDGNLGNDNGQGDHYAEHTGAAFDKNTTYPTPHNGDQWGDIIPQLPDVHSGLNWTTAGQAIYNNDCNVPTTPPTTCVNGSQGHFSDAFTYSWINNGKITVTKKNVTLCAPVTLYFTAYTMPNSWDGTGFNSSASPQSKYGNSDFHTFTNGSGATESATLNVELPSKCTNVQVDLYYAPEINTVTYPAGHGAQYITHKFIKRVPCEVTPCVAVTGPVVITQSNMQGFTTTESRANGHWEFVNDGLRIYTDGNSDTGPRTDGQPGTWNTDKVAWYKAVNFSLQNAGTPELEYTANPDPAVPGKQLLIDFDNNGTIDGILVGEPVYGNDWWLTNSAAQFVKDGAPSHTGGSGSSNHGTLDQWLSNFPNAQVKSIGFSLGSGVKGDGIIKSMTFGCVKYTFKKEVKKADIFASATCTANGVKVTLTNNGNDSGTANVNGQNYTVAAGETKEVIVPVNASYSATVKVTFDNKVIYDATLGCNPGSGGGTPQTPTTPQVLSASTTVSAVLPATIPATGTTEARNPIMIVFAALAAYGAVYFLQGRTEFARKRSQS